MLNVFEFSVSHSTPRLGAFIFSGMQHMVCSIGIALIQSLNSFLHNQKTHKGHISKSAGIYIKINGIFVFSSRKTIFSPKSPGNNARTVWALLRIS